MIYVLFSIDVSVSLLLQLESTGMLLQLELICKKHIIAVINFSFWTVVYDMFIFH